jgi:hypothetical protein
MPSATLQAYVCSQSAQAPLASVSMHLDPIWKQPRLTSGWHWPVLACDAQSKVEVYFQQSR